MAKSKKSKSSGKGKKGKSGGKGKKQKPGSRGKKDKSAGKKVKPGGKGKKDKSEDKRKEEKTESEGTKDKPEGKGKRAKTKSKGSTDKSGSKGKKDKAGGKGKKGKTGSKAKKDKHGGAGKKGKPGSKGKKDKPGGKGKKGKAGGKAKKGTKDGSPSGKKSGSERSSTPDSTIGSTLGQASVSATSSETLFKPLNRRAFSPLVLPADRQLTTVRRPYTIYVWEWDNIWFFPMSVVAMALVVLGMVVMSLSVQVADELQAEDVNATGVANGTISGVANRRPSTEESSPNLPWTSTKPKRRAHTQNPDVAVSYIPEDMSTSKTWIESAVPTVFTGSSEEGALTFLIEQGETEEGHFKADSTDDDMTTQTWFYAPMNGSRETSMASLPLFKVTKSKGVDSDARTQNATAINDNEVTSRSQLNNLAGRLDSQERGT